MAASDGSNQLLQEILANLKSLQQENAQLAAIVDAISGRVNVLAGVKQASAVATNGTNGVSSGIDNKPLPKPVLTSIIAPTDSSPSSSPTLNGQQPISPPPDSGRRGSMNSKIILTSYPGQAGVDPLPMSWGAKDPKERGPIVVSRTPNTIRKRNGKMLKMPFDNTILTTTSHRCPRRLLLHLPRPRRSQQEPQPRAQAGLYQHRACRQHRALPNLVRPEENRRYGPLWTSRALALQRLHRDR